MSSRIRALAPQDADAWAQWRRASWPQRVAARSLDVVASKYWRNPAAARCPGSGLYAYFDRGEILGVIGAMPFPLRIGDAETPGHALVDWAVLPRARELPIGPSLLRFGLSLPGTKAGVGGGPESIPSIAVHARPVQVRAVKIVRESVRVVAAKRLALFGDMRPLAREDVAEPPASEELLERLLTLGDASVASVSRRAADVAHLAADVHLTGIRVWSCRSPAGVAIVSRVAVGNVSGLHVLAVRWEGAEAGARAFGRWIAARIRAESPSYVAVHETPEARAAGLLTLPGLKRWATETWWLYRGRSPDEPAPCRFEGLDSDQLWCG